MLACVAALQFKIIQAFCNITIGFKFERNAEVEFLDDIKFAASLIVFARDFFDGIPHAFELNGTDFGMGAYADGYFYGNIYNNIYRTSFERKFLVLVALGIGCHFKQLLL